MRPLATRIRRALLIGSGLAAAVVAVAVAATVDIHAGSYYFEDATVGDGQLVAQTGDQLRFYIDDNGAGKPHTVEVDALGIHSGPLQKGDIFVTSILTQPGTFTLYCKFHQSQGHVTTLVVQGSAITPPPAPTATSLPTAAPTPVPGATATPVPTAAPTPVPGTTATPNGSANSVTSGEPSQSSVPSSGQAAESAAPSSEAPLPVGVTTSARADWTRSVWIGFAALLPLAVIAYVASRQASQRQAGDI